VGGRVLLVPEGALQVGSAFPLRLPLKPVDTVFCVTGSWRDKVAVVASAPPVLLQRNGQHMTAWRALKQWQH
jgi:hypothetical protein